MTGPSAHDLAAAIRAGETTALAVTETALDAADRQRGLGIFTHLLTDEACAAARETDRRIAAGDPVGSLAGVPIAVKDLFEIAGRVTAAGSTVHLSRPPAREDAVVVARLRAAGAIPIGLTNMDEYAYGFVTENAHYGTTRNPHDPGRICGGSSGGSAAAVAAGIVPLALGSDTNGSIRVPAAFCGIFGLKPTFGRLSRRGTVPFVASFDHVGPFARTVADLALAYDLMQGPDPADPAATTQPGDPSLPALRRDSLHDPATLRVAVLDGWFRRGATPAALEAVDRAARALGCTEQIDLSEAEIARSAAFCITAAEGAALHLPDLRTRPEDFDPATRDRLLAGALIPAAAVVQAQRFRLRFKRQVDELFGRFDILLAPSTPCPALEIGQAFIDIDGQQVPARPNLGLYTQPLSFIGLPVVAVPVRLPGELPLGVQVIAAPWRETAALRVAGFLEREGVASSQIAAGCG
jgi:AtzE family amidohydrolase